MRFKKYITLGVTLLSITSTLVGCSSKDVKVNKEIQGVLESKIEESIGECKVEFGDSEVCDYEFKNDDRYQEVLFINITLKDKSLDSLSKDELEKYGRELLFKGLHKQIHVLYDKYMSSKDSYLQVNLETSKGQLITCDSLDSSLDSYLKSEDCPICRPEGYDTEGYCNLCNEYTNSLRRATLDGSQLNVCPSCLDSINSGSYDNIDMENAN